MTAETRRRIIQALESDLGNAADNLHRARAAFKGRTPEQMAEHYGQSGESCQSILDGYQEWHDKASAALQEARAI